MNHFQNWNNINVLHFCEQLILILPEIYLIYCFSLLLCYVLIYKNFFFNKTLTRFNIIKSLRYLCILILLFVILLYFNIPIINIFLFEQTHHITIFTIYLKIIISIFLCFF
jgi:hypothetical protein